QYAEAWDRLSRIQDSCIGSLDGIDKLPGQGGNAAQALQDVQYYALAREQDARVVADHGNSLASAHANTVENFAVAGYIRMADDIAVQAFVDSQDPANDADACKNTVLLGDDRGRGALLGVDAGARGGIAGGFVLQQRMFQNCGNPAALPIHIVCGLK